MNHAIMWESYLTFKVIGFVAACIVALIFHAILRLVEWNEDRHVNDEDTNPPAGKTLGL